MDASSAPVEAYVFGRFRLDVRRRVLFLDGAEVALAPTAMDMLAYLAAHPGVVVSLGFRARLLADLGLDEMARKLLATETDQDDNDYIFAQAELGDPVHAAALQAAQVRRYPEGTLVNGEYAPQVIAVLAMRRGRPLVAALRPALAYQARDFDILYGLGRAYLAAGDGPHARVAFQTVLDHPGWYAHSPPYTLSALGVARALALEQDIPGARRAYDRFLMSWKGADADVPVVKMAKDESVRLGRDDWAAERARILHDAAATYGWTTPVDRLGA